MGDKGAKLTPAAREIAAGLVEDLEPLGAVTSKQMFGGFGIFADGLMFAIVDSAGRLFLRTGESNVDAFETAGAEKHGRMPYHTVPAEILSQSAELLAWAAGALDVAIAARK